MTVPYEIREFGDEQGLAFLEHLACNLTVAVRLAAGRRHPTGAWTDEQTRLAMYWINETLHDVVQRTRELRREPTRWSPEATWARIEIWRAYRHGAEEIAWAIRRSMEEVAGESPLDAS